MNRTRTVAAIAALAFAGLANAIEITDFPLQAQPSPVSREDVRAQAIAAHQAKALRYDTAGPAVMPMSNRSREDVRQEAAAAARVRDDAAHDFVGGM